MDDDSAFDTLSDIQRIPAVVDKIIVSGVSRTEDDLIKKQFTNLARSQNLNELFENVRNTKNRLEKLGVFKYVYAVVDVADDRSMNDKYKVIFKVTEKRFTTARLSATHGTDGTSKLCGNIRLNNVLRRAESVDLDLEVGTNQLTSKCGTISKPLENNPFVRFSIGGTEGHFDHWWAKFLRHERSVFAEVQALSDVGLHKFQWDAAWREVEAKDLTTPWNVRKESGSALKVGLRHVFERDSRSDLVFPDSGSLFRITQEVASVTPGSPTGYYPNAGDSSFQRPEGAIDRALQLKLDGMMHKPMRLLDWLVAELTFSSGLVHSLTNHPVHISDRFFLGGPLELRGFEWRSVSPVEPLLQPRLPVTDPTMSGDTGETGPVCPVGAEGFWLTGVHLYTPLPYFGAEKGSLASQFRLHGFYVLGSTLDTPVTRLSNCFTRSDPTRSVANRLSSELVGKPRAVIGTGLVVRFAGVLRIEINYCVPIVSQPGDALKSGFSFGFGLNYA